MKNLLVVASIVLTALTLDSCAPGRYTVSAQPAVPVYERPARPGGNYVWVDGDWYWSGGRYVYRNGYWARPKTHRVWVSGAWVRHSKGGYYWKKGYWGKQ